jgi:hypothetical protein
VSLTILNLFSTKNFTILLSGNFCNDKTKSRIKLEADIVTHLVSQLQSETAAVHNIANPFHSDTWMYNFDCMWARKHSPNVHSRSRTNCYPNINLYIIRKSLTMTSVQVSCRFTTWALIESAYNKGNHDNDTIELLQQYSSMALSSCPICPDWHHPGEMSGMRTREKWQSSTNGSTFQSKRSSIFRSSGDR